MHGGGGEPAQRRLLIMRSVLHRVARRLAGEEGFTLTELLMATVLGLFVVGMATMIFTAAVRSQPGLTTRDDQIYQARVTAERLVREFRKPDGTSPTPAAPVVKGLSSASVFSYLGGAGGSNYVTATFEFPGQHGGTGIKVSDGAALRNVPTSYVPTS